eukprot:988152-Prymnesium_polylepis.1
MPCSKVIMDAYEEALARKDLLDEDERKAYASKVGAAIFAGPVARFDALFALGMCARCLTFATKKMNDCIERVIVYMAQTAD